MEPRKMRSGGDSRQGLIALASYLPEDCIGVEVGSYAGESTEIFLSTGKFKSLTCVDSWPEWTDHAAAEKVFDAKKLPVTKLKEKSVVAATRFAPHSLDFVYIDANHSAPHPANDIAAWLPKIKPGGIIAGHDYKLPFEGVINAVDEAFGGPHVMFADSSWMVRV